MRGADVVARTLRRAGVDTVFTLSGNQIMPIFDACIDSGINLVHVRHEAAAVYMADAWSQLSGGVGVALVTAAPGFVNCLTALYGARGTESAVLLLSGDSPVSQDGRGAFQELDQVGVSAPIVKHGKRTTDVSAVSGDIARGIRIAAAGRPGPVHIALPFDVLNAEVSEAHREARAPGVGEAAAPEAGDVHKILELLSEADKPVIITGPALNPTRAPRGAMALPHRLGVPVVTVESPRGLKGPELGNFRDVLPRADLVFFLGKLVDFTVAFGESPAFGDGCRFIAADGESEALDLAAANLGDRLILTVHAHPGATAAALNDHAGQPSDMRGEWRRTIGEAMAERFPAGVQTSSAGGLILPAELCASVQRLLDASDDPVLLADGGEFGQWAQACLSARTRLINGTAGPIGGVLCYAVAAGLRRPGATVVAMMGDGTAGFHLSEFDTAVRHGARFVSVIGNDACWNAERQIQMRDYGGDRLIGCDLLPTRYDLAVSALGGHGEWVTRPEDLDHALQRAASSGLPACVNVRIEGLAAPAGSAH
jgi:acetolactate synthase-1/2/3 large subunit